MESRIHIGKKFRFVAYIQCMEAMILEVLERFARSFDTKDWDEMSACLSDELEVDYSSFRNSKPGRITNSEYIRSRKSGLRKLNTQHRLKNPRIAVEGNRVHSTCDFEIKRFLKNSDRFFHSYGSYAFQLTLDGENWKITSIVQTVNKNEAFSG